MERGIRKRLYCRYGPIKYDIKIPGKINVISGDSSTGKSYLAYILSQIQDNIALNGISEQLADDCIPYEDIVVAGKDPKKFSDQLKENHDKLFIVDNAAAMFALTGIDSRQFTDSDNRFLIFSRQGLRFGGCMKDVGQFYQNGDTIQAVYLGG